jgi:hypothetical protein
MGTAARVLAGCCGLLAVIAVAVRCGHRTEMPAGFTQALRAARHLTSPRHLRRSGYMGAARSRRPSEALAYLFSDMGMAEWPPREDGDAGEREQSLAAGVPLLPADVALVKGKPRHDVGQQLVLSPDDGAGVFVAEGYAAAYGPPLFRETWPMADLANGP